jgi:hypothetical protein
MKGRATDGAVELLPEIAQKIESGNHLDLLIHQRGRMVQAVDFYSEVVREAHIMGSYQIYLSHKTPPDRHVICLFPNLPPGAKDVIKSKDYRYLSSLNKDINASFEKSLENTDVMGTVKFVVCYGQHMYVCKKITGTIYIVWASHVNRTNAGNVSNTIFTNVPIIINMDGQARFKALFILKASVQNVTDLTRIPITQTNPKILFNKDVPLFVCEVRTAVPAQMAITTVSRKEALAAVSATSKRNVDAIRRAANPFASSVDFEEEDVGYMSDCMSATLEVDAGTPRADLFLHDLDQRSFSATPPIVRSDEENVNEPFQEEEQEDLSNLPKKDKSEEIV